MQIFEPLTEFYEAIAEDPKIGVTHISLYMALLQQWNLSGGKNPISIERATIMKNAKISSRYTFNRRMNNLKDYGYITYLPSTNQFIHSYVYLKGL